MALFGQLLEAAGDLRPRLGRRHLRRVDQQQQIDRLDLLEVIPRDHARGQLS